MMDFIKTGTVEGTGALISIAVGFKPKIVKLINVDGRAMLFWNERLGDGDGYKVLTGIDATADTVSLHSLITSNGVTAVDGDHDTKSGFTIGTDSDINVNGETIIWEAYR